MQQSNLNTEPNSKFDSFSREELVKRQLLLEDEVGRLVKELYELRQIQVSDDQLKLITAEQLTSLNETLYGASSERYKKPEGKKKPEHEPKPRIKKPSERYPNVPVREVTLTITPAPICNSCGKQMSDSGMTEDSEQLTVIPKKFEIIRHQRSIYRCSCQACMRTAPPAPRIIPGSSYSNEMVLDIALSKYCDLIPIERYAQMAQRYSGLKDLPPHSLIDLTHRFADFVIETYRLIKVGILKARVLNADETPHKMLEGSDKKSWFLWGFSTPTLCFLECHDTRSGDVASGVLLNSVCEVLVTDVFSGYHKALRVVNLDRNFKKLPPIESGYCNSHSRRYFFKAQKWYSEARFYLDHYHEIYQLNEFAKGKPPGEVLKIRSEMAARFESMKTQALEKLPRYPKGLKFHTALNYFLENYDGLTLFLTKADVPIDNNSQERLLRSHVVGRKTWYGTHSERGAKTAGVLFSIVETCKLNGVNPKAFFDQLTSDLLAGKPAYTPVDFKNVPTT